MPSILIAVDGECTVTQWNKEATALTSTRAAEAIDEPLATVFPLLVPYVPVILRSIHENIIQKDEIRHQVGDHIHMYEIVIYPLLGSGHQGAVIRIDEITEKRRLEEMIVQSEKMMSIGGLAAGMAHEINNPLGAIIQSSQTVQRRLSQELPKNQEVAEALGTNIQTIHQYLEEREIFKFLENIHDGGSRAAKIVTNMLQFSRKSNKTLVPCDLNEVIKRAIEIAQNDYTLSRTGEANTIRLYTRFAEGLEAVPCVSTEIEQVVLNLIKNAAYTIEDKIKDPVLASNWHPQINVETYKEKDFALVRVKDNGLGMSEKVRKHIFEPFFTTKDVGKGTGLGLSVSYFIINSNHKGTMEAHSMKDKGSTFLIRIPLTQASQNSLT